MEGIVHRTVQVNGISMHVAEKGEGPSVVLFLHGFPELWYSWRHQILSLSSRGYRCVAPDLRGYGDSDCPPDVTAYTAFHIVGDLVALIDSLGQDQVFVVAHDWGGIVAWNLCLFRPDKVKALVNMSVVYRPRNPLKPTDIFRAVYGEDYYICRFQAPGVAESDFARTGTACLLKKFLTYRTPAPLMVPKEGFGGSPNTQITLPTWLSEEDIAYFASKFDKSGFTGGLNYYRAMDLNWELMAPWTRVQIKVPVKFIIGDQDLTYNSFGAKDYIHGGAFKENVPFLQDVVVMEGVGHFINQEKAPEITEHIFEFIKKF
ncbi:hypothetical protein QJS04_geneDACA007210 [Acorus gramineus]|uniref:soluble epoxide hydrolase n=1 Tax=Acorus gramineus TaxID=55184 RepID=A0AAV9BLQ3_ACOGR|nr:hypothetical protein QJS04_geneDACA007210 [Acorus gramineus]